MRHSRLVEVVTEITAAVGLAEAFRTADHFHIRLPNPPWMDLVIESWPSYQGPGRRISVAHYYKQNGDLVPDPETEIRDDGSPVSLSQTYGYTEASTPAARADISSFLNMWARNIRDQGFIDAARRYASDRHTVTPRHSPQG